jgi:RNA polymerase-binding protein DksA
LIGAIDGNLNSAGCGKEYTVLDAKELEYFEKLIRARRDQILETHEEVQDEIRKETQKDAAGDLSAYSVHMPDQGTDAMSREMGFHLVGREDKYLKHLDDALARIKDGTFGICKSCGKEIGRKRLEAVPNATECIECKSKRP